MGLFDNKTTGDPTASANARHAAQTGNAPPREVLRSAEIVPMPYTTRVKQNELSGYHYHWFGDDSMRIQYGRSNGYEFANEAGEACEYSEAAKLGGLVRMRCVEGEYQERKRRLNKVIKPQRERAPREAFVNTGNQLNPDTQPFDVSKSRRGPFSQVANVQHDGSLKESED